MIKAIHIDENHPKYKEIENGLVGMIDENLTVVARSKINRKDDAVKPFLIKNGIYFYVGYNHDNMIIYPSVITPSMIARAKANTIANAILGDVFAMFGDGKCVSFDDWEYNNEPMTVVTNKEKSNGAGILACEDFIKSVMEVGDFWIAPSSIHEVILAPTNMITKSEFTDIVTAVNNTEVTAEEYLADRAFSLDEWL